MVDSALLESVEQSGRLTVLPYKQKRKFVCIEFPGVVRNPQKALTMLGGVRQISETYAEEEKRLELKFRPSDIYCNSVYGDRMQTSRLLLKVTRIRRNNSIELQGEILGSVLTSYKFQGMCDFQYLPMERHSKGSYIGLHDSLNVTESFEIPRYLNSEPVVFLPPPEFGSVQMPVKYGFHAFRKGRGTSNELPKNDDDLKATDSATQLKKDDDAPGLAYFTSITVPSEPPSQDEINKLSIDKDMLQQMRILFEERPLWNKLSLQHELKVSDFVVKRALKCVSYYWMSGPWRTCWCRYGYDPRKDPKAKQYQLIDCRFNKRHPLYGNPSNNFELKRPIYSATKSRIFKRPSLPASDVAATINNADLPTTTSSKKSPAVYNPDVLPTYRQIYYQICDICMPSVQKEVHKNDGQETVCHPHDGWCLPGTIAVCRQMMFNATHSLIKQLKKDKGNKNSSKIEETVKELALQDDDDADNDEENDADDDADNDEENDADNDEENYADDDADNDEENEEQMIIEDDV